MEREAERQPERGTGRDGILVVEALLPGVPPNPSRAATLERFQKNALIT